MTVPALRTEDHRVWASWQRAAILHSRTRQHARTVDEARRIVELLGNHASAPAVMWSGGKDSTAMVHLVCVDRGARVPVVSEKDDLDYPGEEAYVRGLADAWGLDLHIVRPEVSPKAWLDAHARELDAGADLHSRASALSKACFYGVIERATEPHDAVLLGLRGDESRGRKMDFIANRALVDGTDVRGLYRYSTGTRAGRWKCQPLGGWSGLDVMAYMAARGIDPLPVYRCVAFMHAREPWRIRKSWWLPEAAGTRHGSVAWLRHYWPALYRQYVAWFPRGRALS